MKEGKPTNQRNTGYYQDILRNIGAGLSLIDRQFRIIWVNKQQKEWFAQGVNGNIHGRRCYEVYQHKTRPCRGCPTLKVFKSAKVEKAIQPGFTSDGKKRYYRLTVSPIKDKHKRVVQALELVEDITDGLEKENKAEKAINKLKQSHEHLLAANRRLGRDTEKLRQINKFTVKSKERIYKRYCEKIEELNIAREELGGIIKINNAYSSSLDLKKITRLIARLTCKIMHTDACAIRLLDEKRHILLTEGEWGLRKNNLSSTPLKLGESISGKAGKTGRLVISNDLLRDSRIKNIAEIKREEGLVAAVAMPLIIRDRILGVITAYSRSSRYFTEEEVRPLKVFASQAAMAIQEAKLCEDIHTTYFNTIRSLVLAMEARDPYTRGHADRVTRYSIEIAQELGISETDMEILRYAGEVHDVGKIAISDLILNKPGKLSPTERAIIELHPVRGAEMLEPLQFLGAAIPLVRHHHERYDGKGYPDGLEKDNIPLMARIMACADAFDAMTSDRPYRQCKMTIEQALEEIKNNSRAQFDPKLAQIFIKIIRNT